ncbi:hypothetical protein SAMN05518672_1016 [Chitinophaga sp. CF118]|uniref:hypothetical protein n=1 Tax=Chitinophaga sp. CF118 TaxID=1884367 RepID=UPI0008E912B8|nr:hypothetical protein [Chitinophaga sp. CF118]SFD00577.1 hypothetical protein SAMN05518672_1016 [Chitinophaga sp. CF118]
MADSYWRFVTPGVFPTPVLNPNSYVQFSGAPPFTTGGPNMAYIWASVQILGFITRPIIGPALTAEIANAVINQVSTPNAYVKP